MLKDCLAGFRILDLSQYLPGPLATRMLADMGADVLKVEPPAGDPVRRVPPLDDHGNGVFHGLLNRGKTLTSLDLKSGDGRVRMDALVARADVLFDTFRPGVLTRLGYDPARLRTINPRLIHCSLTGYGRGGPRSQAAGHDLNYVAGVGGLALMGNAEGPGHPWPPLADHAAATQAALTVVGHAMRRERTGQGASIDIAIADCYLAWQERGLTAACLGLPGQGREAGRLNGGSACYRIYATADGGFVTLAALEERFWSNFCTAVGRPDWISRQAEPLPQTALIAEVAALFQSAPRAHWEQLLGAVDCCFQPVLDHAEVLADPQIAARGLAGAPEDDADIVEVRYPAWVDDTPPPPRPAMIEVSAADAVARWQPRSSDRAD